MWFVLAGIGFWLLIALIASGHLVAVIIGGIAGSFFGIAGFGTGISGAIPGAIIGGLLAAIFRR
jgi:hypothetical protein